MKNLKEAEAKCISSISAHSILLPQSLIVWTYYRFLPLSWKMGSQKYIIDMHACAYMCANTHIYSTFSQHLSLSVFQQLPFFFCLKNFSAFSTTWHHLPSCISPAGKQPAQIIPNPHSPSHHKLSFKPFLETLNPSAIVNWTLGRNLKPWQQLASWRLCSGPLRRRPHCPGQTVQCTQ